MSGLIDRPMDRNPLCSRGIGWGALAMLVAAGCQIGSRPLDEALRSADRPEPPATASQTLVGVSEADLRAILAKPDGWSLAPPPSDGSAGPSPWRWRHAAMEELLAAGGADQQALRRAVAADDATLATNAAVALARLDDASGRDQLVAAVGSPALKPPTRRAAAEALGSLAAAAAVEPLRSLVDQFGVPFGPRRAAYRAELHAELLRGLARHVDPADDPRFEDALRSPSPEVRREALIAWAAGRRGGLSDRAAELSADPDAKVRAAAMDAVARRRHPKALACLADGTRDVDLLVRLAAIEGLGRIGTTEAVAVLTEVLKERSETLRAAAVRALSIAGADEPVLAAAEDKAWQVRAAVAEALPRYPDARGQKLALGLLGDQSTLVQKNVLVATDAWPLELAGPVLLAAMDKLAFQTRLTAAEKLAARWPPAEAFPQRGPPERRAEVLADLRRQFQEQSSGAPGHSTAPAEPSAGQATSPETLAQVERLRQSDVTERRRAARELAAGARERPLGPLALGRLAELMREESDALVWQDVLAAIASDGSEAATSLARLAIGHPASEVRRRACEHLAAHPSPRHARLLLPALEDADEAVVRAAIAGLVAGGRLEDTAPLARLLARAPELVRIDTAAALARFGDPAGVEELLRLVRHRDADVRRRAAQAMGEVADPRFLPVLVGLLDDHLSIRRVVLEALPKVAGHPVPHPANRRPAGAAEEASLWKEWFAQQHVQVLPPASR